MAAGFFFLSGVAGLGGVTSLLPGIMRRASKSACCSDSEMGGREMDADFSLLDTFLGAAAASGG